MRTSGQAVVRRAATTRSTLLALSIGFPGLGFLTGADAVAQTQVNDPLEIWKTTLEKLQGGVWITSNAAYVEEDQGIERFGMEINVQAGGIAATACLWAERSDGTQQVAWQFFQGWDPVRRAGLVYQSHWSGGAGIGYIEDRAAGEPEVIQDFWWPDGSTNRTGHVERWEGPDVRVTTSTNWEGGRWQPRRTYTWVRELEHSSPC